MCIYFKINGSDTDDYPKFLRCLNMHASLPDYKRSIRILTNNRVLEHIVAPNTGIQQVRGGLVAQIRRHGVDAGPPSALGAAGVSVQNSVVGPPLGQCLVHRRRVMIIGGVVVVVVLVLGAVVAVYRVLVVAEYVEVVQDYSGYVGRTVFTVLVL